MTSSGLFYAGDDIGVAAFAISEMGHGFSSVLQVDTKTRLHNCLSQEGTARTFRS